MSYAVTRTKLANLLIKAGYNKAKCLRAVKYPYVEAIQLLHNRTFWDNNTEDIIEFQKREDIYEEINESGYAVIQDKEYNMLGEHQKSKAFLRIPQSSIDYWYDTYGFGTFWFSYALSVRIKYRHRYPRNEEMDAVKKIGTVRGGIADSAGDYGLQEGTIPLPMGGWEKVELPE